MSCRSQGLSKLTLASSTLRELVDIRIIALRIPLSDLCICKVLLVIASSDDDYKDTGKNTATELH